MKIMKIRDLIFLCILFFVVMQVTLFITSGFTFADRVHIGTNNCTGIGGPSSAIGLQVNSDKDCDYVGLNYSEADVVLKNTTKEDLKAIFKNKDILVIIEWRKYYDDGSIDTIFIDPTKYSFHDFWYPMCTDPYSKFIIDSNSSKTISLLKHEILILKREIIDHVEGGN